MSEQYYCEKFDIEQCSPVSIPSNSFKTNIEIIGYNDIGTRFLLQFREFDDTMTQCAIYTYSTIMEEFELTSRKFKEIMFKRWVSHISGIIYYLYFSNIKVSEINVGDGMFAIINNLVLNGGSNITYNLLATNSEKDLFLIREIWSDCNFSMLNIVSAEQLLGRVSDIELRWG